MSDQAAAAELPTVVALPQEIDIANAESVCEEVCAVIATGASIVIADMTATCFCDSAGFRMLLVAHDRAVADGHELRVAVAPGGPVLRALALMGFDRVLRVYMSVDEAVTGLEWPGHGQASPGPGYP